MSHAWEPRFWAKVDKSGDCWEWTASKSGDGYGRFGATNGTKQAHRIAYELVKGPIPEGLYIDHRCHNPGCVNPDHLRPVTQKQNMENLGRLQSNNRSGHRGVHWDSAYQQWMAKLKHNHRTIHLGRFDNLEEAAEAVRLKRLELFTHNEIDKAA